tara:strand:+ start:1168 stop:1854 length:687 start_codon:yes stop_codon:yes gene_type:complete
MLRKFIISALTISLIACATGDIAMIVSDKSTSELMEVEHADELTTIKEAIDTRPLFHIDLERRDANKERQLIPVLPEFSTVIEYDGYKALTSVVQFNAKLTSSMIDVSSYLVRPKEGKKFVLYPILSAVDKDYLVIDTLEPVQSTSKSNSITNTFNLPKGTKYVLVHSAPDFVSPKFFEGMNESDQNLLVGGLGALGGALGGAVAGMVSISGTDNTAPIGYVEIMYSE